MNMVPPLTLTIFMTFVVNSVSADDYPESHYRDRWCSAKNGETEHVLVLEDREDYRYARRLHSAINYTGAKVRVWYVDA